MGIGLGIFNIVMNTSAYTASKNILRGLVKPTGVKMIDKVIMPIGITGMAWTVSDVVSDHMTQEVKDLGNGMKAIKQTMEDRLENKKSKDNVIDISEKRDPKVTLTPEQYEEMMAAMEQRIKDLKSQIDNKMDAKDKKED